MNSEKHIKVTGHSNISWKDAIVKTIDEASKTLANLSHVIVLNQTAKITNNKITEYIVDLEIVFGIEPYQSSDESDDLTDSL